MHPPRVYHLLESACLGRLQDKSQLLFIICCLEVVSAPGSTSSVLGDQQGCLVPLLQYYDSAQCTSQAPLRTDNVKVCLGLPQEVQPGCVPILLHLVSLLQLLSENLIGQPIQWL